ncbi:MAG: outer membrane beta-barrel protein [Magnetospirillum sp. WYHS-4]
MSIKRIVLGSFLSTLVAGAAASPGQADTGIYLEGKAGVSFLDADDFENTTHVDPSIKARVNVKSESETVFGIGGAVGYNWKPRHNVPLRADVEYMYRTALDYSPNPTFINAATPTRTDADMNSHSLLLNGYWDIGSWQGFTPFVGAGFGMAFNRTDTDGTVIASGLKENYTNTNMDFAWTVGGGVSYAISPKWTLGLSYRYLDLGEAAFGDPSATDAELTAQNVSTHEVLLGLRYQF